MMRGAGVALGAGRRVAVVSGVGRIGGARVNVAAGKADVVGTTDAAEAVAGCDGTGEAVTGTADAIARMVATSPGTAGLRGVMVGATSAGKSVAGGSVAGALAGLQATPNSARLTRTAISRPDRRALRISIISFSRPA